MRADTVKQDQIIPPPPPCVTVVRDIFAKILSTALEVLELSYSSDWDNYWGSNRLNII